MFVKEQGEEKVITYIVIKCGSRVVLFQATAMVYGICEQTLDRYLSQKVWQSSVSSCAVLTLRVAGLIHVLLICDFSLWDQHFLSSATRSHILFQWNLLILLLGKVIENWPQNLWIAGRDKILVWQDQGTLSLWAKSFSGGNIVWPICTNMYQSQSKSFISKQNQRKLSTDSIS